MDLVLSAVSPKGKPLAEVTMLSIPPLRTGSLDTLLRLVDECARVDDACDLVLSRIIRQFQETLTGRGSSAVTQPLAVIVGDMEETVDSYLEHFEWDGALVDPDESLPSAIEALQAAVTRAENELKAHTAVVSDKKQALATAQRARSGSLLVVHLEEVLTSDVVCEEDFIETDYLTTEVLVIQKPSEEAFLAEYESLDGGSAPFGPTLETRYTVMGSPVVPRTANRIVEDKEGYVLYTVVILRAYRDSFRAAARAKRYIPRDFTFNPDQALAAYSELGRLELEVEATVTGLRSECKRAFSGVMIAWVHVKALRLFIEAVLRFGVPVNALFLLLRPVRGTAPKLHAALTRAFAHLGEDRLYDAGGEEAERGGLSALRLTEFHPYVCLSMNAAVVAS